MLTDPIADLITRIKNAYLVKKKKLSLPHSKVKENLVKILIANKYLKTYEVTGKKPKLTLEVELLYRRSKPALKNIKRVSKPGVRHYTPHKGLFKLNRGIGIVIISTSKGVMTASEAIKQKIGGEIICTVL